MPFGTVTSILLILHKIENFDGDDNGDDDDGDDDDNDEDDYDNDG